jgi:hypothetical protein
MEGILSYWKTVNFIQIPLRRMARPLIIKSVYPHIIFPIPPLLHFNPRLPLYKWRNISVKA